MLWPCIQLCLLLLAEALMPSARYIHPCDPVKTHLPPNTNLYMIPSKVDLRLFKAPTIHFHVFPLPHFSCVHCHLRARYPWTSLILVVPALAQSKLAVGLATCPKLACHKPHTSSFSHSALSSVSNKDMIFSSYYV